MLGAAGGHVYQMITAHNFAPGNAGIIFWSDILLPVIGFALLWLDRQGGRIACDVRRRVISISRLRRLEEPGFGGLRSARNRRATAVFHQTPSHAGTKGRMTCTPRVSAGS